MSKLRNTQRLLSLVTIAVVVLLLTVPALVFGSVTKEPVTQPVVSHAVNPDTGYEIDPATGKDIVPPVLVLTVDTGSDVVEYHDNDLKDLHESIDIACDVPFTLTQNVAGQTSYSIRLTGSGLCSVASTLNTTGSIVVLAGGFATQDFSIDAYALYFGTYDDVVVIPVSLGTSIITCDVFAVRGSGVLLDSGKSTINTTLLFDDKTKSGHTYNKVVVKDKGSIQGFVEGYSSFDELNLDSDKDVYLSHSVHVHKLIMKSDKVKPARPDVDEDVVITVDLGQSINISMKEKDK